MERSLDPQMPAAVAGIRSAWVLSDGKAGDESQCLGVIEALGPVADIRRIAPRSLFAWLAPRGPIDPAEAPDRPGSPIAPPFPDLLVASGRRAVPYLRAVRRRSGGRTFTVFLKDPRTGAGTADLIWVPEHDRLRGPNVVATVIGPHRISPACLAAARAAPDARLAALRSPRVAVLVGGDSRHHRFKSDDIERLVGELRTLAAAGAGLMVTTSRRTPAGLADALRLVCRETGGFFWGGDGENPYAAMLALADAVVASADSTNMVGEAAATGAPIRVFEPSGGHPKITAFLDALSRCGIVKPLAGLLAGPRYQPLDTNAVIAAAIVAAFGRHRAAFDNRQAG